MMTFDDDERQYVVLRNDEGQYSLWPADMKAPQGWEVTEASGLRKDCLAYVERVWTDMRPASAARASKVGAAARTRART